MSDQKNKKANRVRYSSESDHYIWGDNCDGWHLVKNAGLSVIRETMPPGTSEKRHYHEKAQQFFYILSGEATFEIEGETLLVKPNQGISIQPMEKHCIANQAQTELSFVLVSTPPAQGDRINLE